jgi:quercetin dioxygenase-like cupin family protein
MEAKEVRWDQIPAEQLAPLLSRRYISIETMTAAQFQLKRGCSVPRHQHENEQLSFVLTGALKYISDAGEHVVTAGGFFIIPANVPHAAEAVEDCVVLDVFAPPRADWESKTDSYLRDAKSK